MLNTFKQVWLVDFEFFAPSGERQMPLCLVAKEFYSGLTFRIWEDELRRMPAPPFDCGASSLFVAYYSSAEFGCFLALGWPMPARVLDLFTEFRCLTNGLPTPCGNGLIGALTYFGLDSMDVCEKDTMRELAMRGGPYSDAERAALMDYCGTDVVALTKLLPAMESRIDWPRALLRGRYMPAAAAIEWNGIPVDFKLLNTLKRHWMAIQSKLILAINAEFGVYVSNSKVSASGLTFGSEESKLTGMSFSAAKFSEYLVRNRITWPRLSSGALCLDDNTFRDMVKVYPQISPLREIRNTLGQLRLNDLAVGMDGRNRTLLSVFRAKTGRNQPSNSKFVFGPSCWLRSLIRPEPRRAIAYVDWEQQEFGVAAALSGDTAMQVAYASGDPYLAFAKQAGAVPRDATKSSHPTQRAQFKVCALAVQYGMREESLAMSLSEPVIMARQLLRLHRQTYPKFWEWSEGAVNHAMLFGFLDTVFGWRIHVGSDANPRSLANFPCQANGAEMLRLACCLMTETGLCVCAPVHDAVLIEAADADIDMVVAQAQAAMCQASEIVLDGFALRTEIKVVRYPERYSDERGEKVWNLVMGILKELGVG